jgi:preprotein translocase subunit SecG
MGILIGFLIVLEVVICFLLIGIVLLQKSREQGLGMAFGASVGESLFGSRAGNVLTKGTIVLGSLFVANTLLMGVLYAGRAGSLVERELKGKAPPPTVEMPETRDLAPESGAVDLSRDIPPPPAPDAPGPVPEAPESPPTPEASTPESDASAP